MASEYGQNVINGLKDFDDIHDRMKTICNKWPSSIYGIDDFTTPVNRPLDQFFYKDKKIAIRIDYDKIDIWTEERGLAIYVFIKKGFFKLGKWEKVFEGKIFSATEWAHDHVRTFPDIQHQEYMKTPKKELLIYRPGAWVDYVNDLYASIEEEKRQEKINKFMPINDESTF